MKKFLSILICAVMLIGAITATVFVSSAATGDLASDPVKVTLGQSYYKGWTSSTYGKYHYVSFTIEERGMVTIRATKPADSDEYGRINFAIYDTSNNIILENATFYAVDDLTDYYEIGIGLEPGTYMFTMKPGFTVKQGVIGTNYTVSHTPTQNCELEPNGIASEATPISTGNFFVGYIGSDGLVSADDDDDYYKFEVVKGRTYKLIIKDYSPFAQTSAMVQVKCPGDSYSTKINNLSENVDKNGYNYGEFTAKESGTAYFRVYNYMRRPFKYEFAVVDSSLKGWKNENGKWAFYENGMKVTSQWRMDSKGWCYLDADGYMVSNGWVADSKGECYIGFDGYIVGNCWAKYGNDWVYVDANGRKVVNQWRKDSKGWCYLTSTGAMATNRFVPDSKGECYVGPNGYILSNQWVQFNGKWTYVDANGRRSSTNRWMYKSPNWLYLGSDGYAVTNKWIKDSTGWCYLDSEGLMVTNDWVADSKGECYIGPKGYIISKCWIHDGTGWVYLNSEGRRTTNSWAIDSKGWCYLGEDGYAIQNAWMQDSKGWCYLDAAGHLAKNQFIKGEYYDFYAGTVDGVYGYYYRYYGYYVDANGYRVVNSTVNINGANYSFDSEGHCIGSYFYEKYM